MRVKQTEERLPAYLLGRKLATFSFLDGTAPEPSHPHECPPRTKRLGSFTHLTSLESNAEEVVPARRPRARVQGKSRSILGGGGVL